MAKAKITGTGADGDLERLPRLRRSTRRYASLDA
jgi:hypothetical protein